MRDDGLHIGEVELPGIAAVGVFYKFACLIAFQQLHRVKEKLTGARDAVATHDEGIAGDQCDVYCHFASFPPPTRGVGDVVPPPVSEAPIYLKATFLISRS